MKNDKTRTLKRKGRVQRACFNCRKCKQGCEDERPCKRCKDKGIPCTEVESHRPKKQRIQRSSSIQEENSSPNFCLSPEESSSSEPTSELDEIESEISSIPENEMDGIEENKMDDKSDEKTPPPEFDLNLNLVLTLLGNVTGIQSFPFQPFESPDENPEIQVYIQDCWEEYLQRMSEDKNFEIELDEAQEKWSKVMCSLRALDWPKVQSYLQEMDGMNEQKSSDHLATLFWSSGGRIHYANQAFCNLVGYNLNELRVGTNGDVHKIGVHTLFHPDEMVKILAKQLEVVQDSENPLYQLQTKLLSKQKKVIPVSCSISNLKDAVGLNLLTVAHFIPLQNSEIPQYHKTYRSS